MISQLWKQQVQTRSESCTGCTKLCEQTFWGLFSQQMCPFHLIGLKNSCIDAFCVISSLWKWQARTKSVSCTGYTKLCERSFWIFYRNKHAQSSLLDPKLMFCAISPLWKRHVWIVSRSCTGCTKLCERTFWRFFRNKRAQTILLDPKTDVLMGFTQFCHC